MLGYRRNVMVVRKGVNVVVVWIFLLEGEPGMRVRLRGWGFGRVRLRWGVGGGVRHWGGTGGDVREECVAGLGWPSTVSTADGGTGRYPPLTGDRGGCPGGIRSRTWIAQHPLHR